MRGSERWKSRADQTSCEWKEGVEKVRKDEKKDEGIDCPRGEWR